MKAVAVQGGLGTLRPCPGHSGSSLPPESVNLPASMPVGLGLSHMGLLLCVPKTFRTPGGHPCHSRLGGMSTQPLSACRADCVSLALELKACLPCSLLPGCPSVSGLHGWPCLTLSRPEGRGGGMGAVCTVQLLFRGSGRDQCPLLCSSPWLGFGTRGVGGELPLCLQHHLNIRFAGRAGPEPLWKLTKKAHSWAPPGRY